MSAKPPVVPTTNSTSPAPAKRSWRSVIGIVVLVGMAILASRFFDLRQVVSALRTADWRLVLLACVAAAGGCMLSCSRRLWLLIRPLPHSGVGIGFWPLVSVYFSSSAANQVLPPPAAEVFRTIFLKRRYGYSLPLLLASQLLEKVIDALGLSLETLVVALFLPLPSYLQRSLFVFASVTGLSILAILLSAYWHSGQQPTSAEQDQPSEKSPSLASKLRTALAQLARGFYYLRQPQTWAAALWWSVLNDVANAASMGLVLLALGAPLPVGAWFVLILVTRLAAVVPATPGQLGVVEAGLVVTMGTFGVAMDRALAVALVYRLVHFLPIVSIGVFEMRKQSAVLPSLTDAEEAP